MYKSQSLSYIFEMSNENVKLKTIPFTFAPEIESISLTKYVQDLLWRTINLE
jgi:hypothetical protein